MTSEKNATREGLDKLGKYRQYFLAGHSRWFVFVMGLSNFSLIFYNFLWVKLTFVPDILKNEFVFLLIFFVTYIPVVTSFGRWDLMKGTFKAETNVSRVVNPIIKEQFERFDKIEAQNQRLLERFNEMEKRQSGGWS